MFQVPLLCFSSAIQENDELTDVSPDSEFHADTFIKLKEGITAYKVIEPKISFTEENTGVIQTIVCLHGLYNSSYMWADLVDLLTDFDQGPMSRVLILDFYGRGRSPWTGVPITLDVLVNQVKELIDVLKLSDSPVAFIGYDMGGAVATGFAAKFPNYCLSLTLISPLGIKFKSSLNEKVMQRKYSGIYYMSKQKKILEDLQESDFHDADMLSSHRYLIDKQKLMIKWQIKYTNGYLASLLSTYRYFPVRNMEELFTSIGRHPRKTLVIWGIQDKVCNYKKCIRAIEEDFPHGTVLDVADCGHNCVFEKFEDVAREILSFHEEVFEDDENYDDVAV